MNLSKNQRREKRKATKATAARKRQEQLRLLSRKPVDEVSP
jgi:hypothetical protein